MKAFGKRWAMPMDVCRLTKRTVERTTRLLGLRAARKGEKAGGQATDVEAITDDNQADDDAADSGNINDLIPTGDVELTPEEEVALAEAIGPFVEQIRDELGV